MSYNAKNYTEQGGNRTIIGGEVVIGKNGKWILEYGAQMKVEGAPGKGVLVANDSGAIVLEQARGISESAASTVATLKDDLNALINALKLAGIIAEN